MTQTDQPTAPTVFHIGEEGTDTQGGEAETSPRTHTYDFWDDLRIAAMNEM